MLFHVLKPLLFILFVIAVDAPNAFSIGRKALLECLTENLGIYKQGELVTSTSKLAELNLVVDEYDPLHSKWYKLSPDSYGSFYLNDATRVYRFDPGPTLPQLHSMIFKYYRSYSDGKFDFNQMLELQEMLKNAPSGNFKVAHVMKSKMMEAPSDYVYEIEDIRGFSVEEILKHKTLDPKIKASVKRSYSEKLRSLKKIMSQFGYVNTIRIQMGFLEMHPFTAKSFKEQLNTAFVIHPGNVVVNLSTYEMTIIDPN